MVFHSLAEFLAGVRQEASTLQTFSRGLLRMMNALTAADSTSQHDLCRHAPCPAPHHLLAGMASSVSAQEPDDERDCLGAIPVPMSGGDNQWLQFMANVAPVRAAYAATFGIVTTNLPKGEDGKIHRMTMKYCLDGNHRTERCANYQGR